MTVSALSRQSGRQPANDRSLTSGQLQSGAPFETTRLGHDLSSTLASYSGVKSRPGKPTRFTIH